VKPGFDPAGVMTATITLPRAQYGEPAKQAAFYRAVLARLSGLPGATSVATGFPVPLSGQGNSASFGIEGRLATPGDPGPHGDLGFVSPEYFSVLRIPLRQGRVFTDQDAQGTEPVAIIDDVLARQYWPNENPLGKHMRQGQQGPWRTVVGLVGHVKHFDLAADDVKGKYYFPAFQRPIPFATFLVRTPSDPARLSSAIRQAVQAVDPALPVSQMRSMEERVAESLASRRFIVTLLGAFSGIALLMAVLGLYGVISYSVAQRTQELGIRMALGAQRGEVLTMVIGQGVRLAGLGAIVGLGASAAIGSALRSQLFRVSPFDPLTLGATAAVLLGAALLASYIPARRATLVDPVEALRHE
jgi:predicted permease